MELDDEINLAKNIAFDAHNGQFRKDKKTPYFSHVNAVAFAVEDRLKPIAYLHDVVEDTNVTIHDLKHHGFSQYILDAVELLTHKHGDSNAEYWKKIAVNADAVTVKLADINHNLSETPSDVARKKYHRALEFFKSLGYNPE